jgi:hypothetical protein
LRPQTSRWRQPANSYFFVSHAVVWISRPTHQTRYYGFHAGTHSRTSRSQAHAKTRTFLKGAQLYEFLSDLPNSFCVSEVRVHSGLKACELRRERGGRVRTHFFSVSQACEHTFYTVTQTLCVAYRLFEMPADGRRTLVGAFGSRHGCLRSHLSLRRREKATFA